MPKPRSSFIFLILSLASLAGATTGAHATTETPIRGPGRHLRKKLIRLPRIERPVAIVRIDSNSQAWVHGVVEDGPEGNHWYLPSDRGRYRAPSDAWANLQAESTGEDGILRKSGLKPPNDFTKLTHRHDEAVTRWLFSAIEAFKDAPDGDLTSERGRQIAIDLSIIEDWVAR